MELRDHTAALERVKGNATTTLRRSIATPAQRTEHPRKDCAMTRTNDRTLKSEPNSVPRSGADRWRGTKSDVIKKDQSPAMRVERYRQRLEPAQIDYDAELRQLRKLAGTGCRAKTWTSPEDAETDFYGGGWGWGVGGGGGRVWGGWGGGWWGGWGGGARVRAWARGSARGM